MRKAAAVTCLAILTVIAVLGAATAVAQVPGRQEEMPSGDYVLNKIDENLFLDHAVVLASMVLHGRSGTRTIESRSWRKGVDSVLVEYLSPAREKGKKMLKLGGQVWNYIPEPTDRIIAISGHLLRQSVMGSDLSYEDITENHRLRDKYDAEVVGRDSLDGRECYVVELRASTEDVAYHSRRVWVDSGRWLPLREERFAKSGKLLKTTGITEVMKLKDRWYPRRMVFKDELSKGEGTEYIVKSVDLETEVPGYLLNKAALRK
ncbi:MAG: outer membrane lipoprotein-sorting protein [bacterium]|jgi:outer membrane lipoprotein-sorting protein